MTQELLYTSAPKGLKPGSRGFCTVVSTHGMPAPLVTALESLSAYRQVFPHGHARSSDNPVNWSHVLMSAGGRPVHVLSRISDYGLDYTQRSNKLAHHLVLAESECPPAGPAWVLQQHGVAQDEWDGTVRTLPQGRVIPSGRAPSLRAGAWEQATGDAGWAGVVADALLADPHRQIFLIYTAGQDLLPLVAEVIALLPESLRWGITFSTYATQLPPNATCQWRCHLSDSPEAQQSLRFVKALRIDLTKSLGMAPGGPLVETARTGRSTPQPTTHATTTPSPASPPDIEFTEAVAALPPARHESTAHPPTSTYRLARSPDAPSIRPAPPPMRRPARSRSMPIGLIGFVFAVSLVVLATIGSVFFAGRRPQQDSPNGQVVASEAETPEAPPPPNPPDDDVAAEAEGDQEDMPPISAMIPENAGGPESPMAPKNGDPPLATMPGSTSGPGSTTRPDISFLPEPLTKDGLEKKIRVLESSSSEFSVLTPELLSGVWETQNDDSNCVIRNETSTVLAKFSVDNSLDRNELLLESAFVSRPELSWCGVYVNDGSSRVVLLRERYSYDPKLPMTLKFRDGWSTNQQRRSGLPRIHFAAQCEIHAKQVRLRFSLSSKAIADPYEIAPKEIVAEGSLADGLNLASLWGFGDSEDSTANSQSGIRLVIQSENDGLTVAMSPSPAKVAEPYKEDIYGAYKTCADSNKYARHLAEYCNVGRKSMSFTIAAKKLRMLVEAQSSGMKKKGGPTNSPEKQLLTCLEDTERKLSAVEQLESDLGNSIVTEMRVFYRLDTKNATKDGNFLVNNGNPIDVDLINIGP